ncbi:MAG: tetratricopeptide repeat protein [Bacteroidota bacterium]
MAHNLNDIGFTYASQNNYEKAITYYKRSLQLQQQINDRSGETTSLNNIGDALLQLGHINEAFDYADRSMKVAKELGFPEDIMCAAITLKAIYKKQNKYKEAFATYDLFIQMRDTIESEEAKKASIKKQFQYQYEKKAAADSVKHAEERKVKNAQLIVQRSQLKQEKTKRLALYSGLVLMIAFLGFVFNRFIVTQKQKAIIEQQKILVDEAFKHLEEKNKEVMDSIHYAKKIQQALLTSEQYINNALNRLS